jgi:hypothetical protein
MNFWDFIYFEKPSDLSKEDKKLWKKMKDGGDIKVYGNKEYITIDKFNTDDRVWAGHKKLGFWSHPPFKTYTNSVDYKKFVDRKFLFQGFGAKDLDELADEFSSLPYVFQKFILSILENYVEMNSKIDSLEEEIDEIKRRLN